MKIWKSGERGMGSKKPHAIMNSPHFWRIPMTRHAFIRVLRDVYTFQHGGVRWAECALAVCVNFARNSKSKFYTVALFRGNEYILPFNDNQWGVCGKKTLKKGCCRSKRRVSQSRQSVSQQANQLVRHVVNPARALSVVLLFVLAVARVRVCAVLECF